ncbi:RagB/SusD family nutrient uptake outer membrane protein [Urechidicola sp. KH5]
MKTYFNKIILGALVALLSLTACFDDLDTVPQTDDLVLAEDIFKDPSAYKQILAKLYAGLAISGQQGPAGLPDISGIDEGFSQYLRQYWLAQEVTTDEAVIGWADGSLPDYHEHDWNSGNEFIRALYNRLYYQITACNAFLRQTTPTLLDERGVEGTLRDEVELYREEARFLRALSYTHALDLFGNVPFVTEEDEVGFFLPEQINRTDLFTFIESELLAIENTLMEPRSNEYARVDKAGAWTLLAKIYLNAEVYTGQSRYADVVTYTDKVINAGYTLEPEYANLFLADNHLSNGVIFPIAFDGLRTQSYGGTTFLIHAAIGGSMNASDFGVNGGWGGTRTTSALVNLFEVNLGDLQDGLGPVSSWGIVGDATPNGWGGPDLTLHETGVTDVYETYVTLADGQMKFRQDNQWTVNYGDNDADGTLELGGANIIVEAGSYKITFDLANLVYSIQPVGDARAMFYTDGQNKEIENIPTFTDGYAITKFKNVDQAGNAGSDPTGDFTDTDFPLMRLGDVYLMYAEAVVRGGGGSESMAIGYLNELRTRAGNPEAISMLDLDLILDERARELYWEGHRRTDLIRFGRFSGGAYLWPWKGGVTDGVSTPAHLDLYPIPSSDINANPNLNQNEGYN